MKSVNENQYIVNRRKILYEQRYTMKRLGLDIGITGTSIDNAITCKVISYKTQKKIADKLGTSIIKFWPELYGDQPAEPAENIVSQDVCALSTRC
jgi:lambda repressor-like predicted transcriptional regulator